METADVNKAYIWAPPYFTALTFLAKNMATWKMD